CRYVRSPTTARPAPGLPPRGSAPSSAPAVHPGPVGAAAATTRERAVGVSVQHAVGLRAPTPDPGGDAGDLADAIAALLDDEADLRGVRRP
ncbi:hypothetical protein, partial [Occultella glacieicola]|uniref:hypothetical protein n=1 Tax=Occultella glacieicola TaxID=2518684 RepID=UPI001A9D9539